MSVDALASHSAHVVQRQGRRTLVLRPPQRPLSVVTMIRPTRLTAPPWYDQEGMAVFGHVGLRDWPPGGGSFSRRAGGMRIRSCALRIFDAATISMALVILRVFFDALDLGADFFTAPA